MVLRDVAADDTDDDDGAHDQVMMLMLPGEWYVFVHKTITYNTSLDRRECWYYGSYKRYLPPRVNLTRIEDSGK